MAEKLLNNAHVECEVIASNENSNINKKVINSNENSN